ncbi:MAG: PHP domain-containing protein [Candidatus Helarchaeota archaeon]
MIDLHIHTIFSDGNNNINEVCKEAKKKKIRIIAITDHYTTGWKSKIINHLRLDNINHYLEEIDKIKENYNLKILKGIEIDMNSNISDIKKIPFNQFDLILLECIKSIETMKNYIAFIRKKSHQNSNNSQIIALAHPNIHLYLHNTILKQVFIPYLVKEEIYFELNSRYSNYFINHKKIINNLISSGVKFTIGSDSHSISRVGDISISYMFLKDLNGMDNLIDMKKLNG